MKFPSVILLSGGLDSAANLALCSLRDQPVLALTVDYGQRAARQEFGAASRLAAHFGVPHQTLDLRWLGGLGGSSLTDSKQSVPELERSQLDTLQVIQETARSVWVPNRNGVLIQAAAAYSEVIGAARVVVGFNREEGTTFPDNTQAFLDASSHALSYSTRAGSVSVHCYTTALDKREIVATLRGLERPFPFELLWSCYHGGDRPCGRCESCQRLKRALEGA
jgi:7-cyano-7-deazaguanine synthase